MKASELMEILREVTRDGGDVEIAARDNDVYGDSWDTIEVEAEYMNVYVEGRGMVRVLRISAI